MVDPVTEYLSRIGRRGAAKTNNQLTPAQRKNKARRAAEARWAKNKTELDATLDKLEQANRKNRAARKAKS